MQLQEVNLKKRRMIAATSLQEIFIGKSREEEGENAKKLKTKNFRCR